MVSGPPARHGGLLGGLDVRVDQRVGDRVERRPRGLVGEDDPGQLGPVQRPVRPQHPGPEGLGDLRQPGRARLDDRPGGLVAVQHDGPEGGQPLGHRALPRPDPARQPDPQHAAPSKPRRTRAHDTPPWPGPAGRARSFRPYGRVTCAGMSTLWPAQPSVTPAAVTLATRHWVVVTVPCDPPKFAEYAWLSSVTGQPAPPGWTAKT